MLHAKNISLQILCTATFIILLNACSTKKTSTTSQPDRVKVMETDVSSDLQDYSTNQTCIDYIKEGESLRLAAYVGPAGHWLIGYGHKKDVKPGTKISMQEAEKLLKEDLRYIESAVKRLVKVDINQNQFSAIVCLAYNIGTGNLAKSTLLRKLNQGNYQETANQFLVWRKANGKVSSHLEARRKKEKALFEK